MFMTRTNKVFQGGKKRVKSSKSAVSTISCRLIRLSGAGANAAGPPFIELVPLNRMLSASANASRESET